MNYISGVADYQRNVLGMEFQTTLSRQLVNAALKGLRRTQDKPSKKKLAITADMLLRIQAVVADESFAKLAGHKPSAIRCVFAAILVGFFGMLRKANIASKTARTFDPKRCLLRSDIQLDDQQTLMLTCRFSKTIKGSERVHKLPLIFTGGALCPVSAYTAHVAEFPSADGDEQQPAFMYDSRAGKRTALSYQFLVDTIKELLEFVGENPYDYAGHSLRIGGATLAFAVGAPATNIMLLGDWVSKAVFGYNQPDSTFLQSLPRQMAEATFCD